jgi:hypothetical protein
VSLTQGERYRVSVFFDRGVFDGPLMAQAAGFGSSFFKLPAMPFARWWRARWLQPIARIAGADGHGEEWPLPLLHEAEIPPRVVRSWRPTRVAGWGFWQSFVGGCAPLQGPELVAASETSARAVEAGQLRSSFTAEFTSAYNGELFLYLNDALVWMPLVGLVSCAYENNAGVARVVVTPLPADR